MTEQPPSQQPEDDQAPQPPAAFAGVTTGQTGPVSTTPAPEPAPFPPAGPTGGGSPFPADRPEIAVGAAFAGGLALALILKRLGR